MSKNSGLTLSNFYKWNPAVGVSIFSLSCANRGLLVEPFSLTNACLQDTCSVRFPQGFSTLRRTANMPRKKTGSLAWVLLLYRGPIDGLITCWVGKLMYNVVAN